MRKLLSLTDVLNKLPLASTQFLCPTEYHLLNLIIRLAYNEGDASIPIDTLHNGADNYNTAVLRFNNKVLHPTTIAKHRQALIDKKLISYRLKPVHKTVRSYGDYTLNKPCICDTLSSMYDKAVCAELFKALLDPMDYVCQRDKRARRAQAQATLTRNRMVSYDSVLSATDAYIYDITTSLCMLTGSLRFMGYPSKLHTLLNHVSRKQIYRSLETLGCKNLISLDYNINDKRIHELWIPGDIRLAHGSNQRILRVQQ